MNKAELIPYYATLDVLRKVFASKHEKIKVDVLDWCSVDKPVKAANWSLMLTETPASKIDLEAMAEKHGKDFVESFRTPTKPRREIKCIEANRLETLIKKVDITPELCDEVMAVVVKHMARKAKGK